MGKSTAPPQGYSFEHGVSDLKAVLDTLDTAPSCLMAFSLGVPVVLGYAVRHPQQVRGVISLDYPARYPKRSSAWLEQALPFARQQGVPDHVVQAIFGESEEVELWDKLDVLTCPVLLIKGGRSPTLPPELVERYRSALPQIEIEIFEDSGHEVHQPDYERFIGKIERFLASLD